MKYVYGLMVWVEAFVMILIGIIMIFSAEKAIAEVTTLGLVSITVMFLFFRGDLNRYKRAMRGEPISPFLEYMKELEEARKKEEMEEEKAKQLAEKE